MSAHRYNPAPDRAMMDQICLAIIRKEGYRYVDVVKTSPNAFEVALKRAEGYAPSVLGRLAFAYPEAYLYGVHSGTWLGKYDFGPEHLQRIAATAIVVRLRELLKDKASFDHDCSECKFLGSTWRRQSAMIGLGQFDDPRIVDLYDTSHQGLERTVLVRFGTGDAYISGPLSAFGDEPHFKEAAKRM